MMTAKKSIRRWSAFLLALMMAFTMSSLVFAEAGGTAQKTITVKVTVSNKGVLGTAKDGTAMVEKEVEVKDRDGDGKFTLHEALIATHEAYCSAGAAGYDAPESGYGGLWVTKLWGEDTGGNTLFFQNDAGTKTVDATEVKAGDKLLASVNLDSTNYCDMKTQFDKTVLSANTGDSITVILTGRVGMSSDKDAPIAGAKIGYWEKGTFKALDGIVTDANGKATFKAPEAGEYLLSANGVIKDGGKTWEGKVCDAPIIAPYCFLTVKSPMSKAVVKVASATYTGKALKPKVTVKMGSATLKQDTDYTVAYSANKKAGKGKVTVTGIGSYSGTATATFTINKAKQPMKVSAKARTFKAKLLKKKKITFNAITVKKNQGKASYTVKYANKKSKKYLKFAKGKITVKKKTPKGIYKVIVTVKAKGNKNYKAGNVKKTIKVTVK